MRRKGLTSISIDARYLDGSYVFKLVSPSKEIILRPEEYELDRTAVAIRIFASPPLNAVWTIKIFAEKPAL